VLENRELGKVRGTCLIFAKIGSEWPFYNYRIGTLSQYSKELDRTVRAEMLTLCTDLEGASEVGGLFLHPNERSGGVGKLLARSRYLFIAMHRARFAATTMAELRGAIDDVGNSPFWDALAGRFFEMSFRDGDDFNAVNGNQFIADLMPKHPIYTALLPESARAVIGVPHQTGRPAMRMLEKEGFVFDKYIDIFDGGPAMTCATDRIATIQATETAKVVALADGTEGERRLVAHGRLAQFRCGIGHVAPVDGGVTLDRASASLLGVSPGETITHVPA
jgi:arginine N-succinyltransferase